MSEHCKQDGGFIGKAGCTHPNHQHSELVKSIMSGRPRMISEQDAETALKEGFYVPNPNGKRIGFGEDLLKHIEGDVSHGENDIVERKRRLMFAVATVTNPDKTDPNHRSIPGRTAYAKAFDEFGILVITGPDNETVDKVYTYFPRRSGKKR